MCKQIILLFVFAFFLLPAFTQSTKTAADLYEEGLKLKEDGECKEAIELYKTAVAQKPGYTDALYEMGWCYNELEDYKNVNLDKKVLSNAAEENAVSHSHIVSLM